MGRLLLIIAFSALLVGSVVYLLPAIKREFSAKSLAKGLAFLVGTGIVSVVGILLLEGVS